MMYFFHERLDTTSFSGELNFIRVRGSRGKKLPKTPLLEPAGLRHSLICVTICNFLAKTRHDNAQYLVLSLGANIDS